MTIFSMIAISFIGLTANAHTVAEQPQVVLTDLAAAKAVGGFILSEDEELGVATVYLTADQINLLSSLNHSQGKCAGFEVLNKEDSAQPGKVLRDLSQTHQRISFFKSALAPQINFNEDYQKLIDQASALELKKTVSWLASYHSRYHQSANPNQHVHDLKVKLNSWLRNAPWSYTIETIAHDSTKQLSLRLRIPGQRSPHEVVVLGGHLDSINKPDIDKPADPKARAPGTDDNASGSSNLIEALKLLKQVKSFDRTLEFYWYAGEEGGLLGSAEIAKEANANKRKIIGVLQLDMTLFAGSGQQVIGSISDFTSPGLRDLFYQINDLYIKSKVIESICGYACSDHVSWHRQGYPAIMPTEASFKSMNKFIHTDLDLILPSSNFDHSNNFTKYATLFALVLGNSSIVIE